MGFLGYFLGIIGLGLFFGAFGEKERLEKNKETNKSSVVKMFLIGTILAIAGIGIIVSENSSGSSNKWESLTKEEKKWYQDNYGNGKSEQYTKAIEDYKKSH